MDRRDILDALRKARTPKMRVTFTLDEDIQKWIDKGRPGNRSRFINAILRIAMDEYEEGTQ